MSKALISIIIPFYNREQFLERCLQSVLQQTLKEIEIICIDDGSTDGSYELVKQLASQDKRIKLYKNDINKGIAYTRNRGLELATADIIGFVDSDDYIEPSMYEVMLAKHRETGSDITFCNFTEINEVTQAANRTSQLTESMNKESVFRQMIYGGVFAALWNKIYNKQLFQLYDIHFPDSHVYEDAMVLFKLIHYANKIAICTESFYTYFINESSITIQVEKNHIADAIQKLDITKQFLQQHDLYHSYTKEYLKKVYSTYVYLLNHIKNSSLPTVKKRLLVMELWKQIIEHNDSYLLDISKPYLLLYFTYLFRFNDIDFLEAVFQAFQISKSTALSIQDAAQHELGLSFLSFQNVKARGITQVYLYGTGVLAHKLIDAFQQSGIGVLGIIESFPTKKSFAGYTVHALQQIDFSKIDDYIVLASEGSAYEIYQELTKHIDKNKVIGFVSFHA